jgi:hypothetical protein
MFRSRRPWNRSGLQPESPESSIGVGGIDASEQIKTPSAAACAVTIVQTNAEPKLVQPGWGENGCTTCR